MRIRKKILKLPVLRRAVLLILLLLINRRYMMVSGDNWQQIRVDDTQSGDSGDFYLPLVLSGFPLPIEGIVYDAGMPVAGAVVRVQATDQAAVSDALGHYALYAWQSAYPFTLTAWAPGYYITAKTSIVPGDTDVDLHLIPHTSEDNDDYQWLSAFSTAGDAGNCENCHTDASGHLPFDEWQLDAHAQTMKNIRFQTMYNGTDLWGNQSPLTRYNCTPDYGCVPLPPDPSQPYYGPGYRLDFPHTAGNCAACHAPAAAINQPYGIDPNLVTGVGAEGVTCDFCHKIWGVKLNQDTGLPNANMPGVLSYSYRRPPEGHQFFAGPYDDVAPGEDTYSPLQNESQFCAPCHFGQFWDTIVYNSFGEWLESPYADPQDGQTCQDCHMPPDLTDHFARADQGGLIRNPSEIFSHQMPGALDTTLLQNALTMKVETSRDDNQVHVQVLLTNDKTGHHIPTDSPLRHLILLVEVYDQLGNPLMQSNGPILPDWCGVGDPDLGYYAGLPGKVYAKVLEELWTKITPTGSYWSQTTVVEDNRIPAMGSDTSNYDFDVNPGDIVTIKVTLLYRRAFKPLMDQKGWDAPDIEMAVEQIVLD